MHNHREIYKYLAIFSLGLMLVGLGPWGSDVFGYLFNLNVRYYITFSAFIAFLSFFVGYLKAERASTTGFSRRGNRLYAINVLDNLSKNNISTESVEKIILSGTQTKRIQSIKYSSYIGNKSVLVYTDLNNAVIEVVF